MAHASKLQEELLLHLANKIRMEKEIINDLRVRCDEIFMVNLFVFVFSVKVPGNIVRSDPIYDELQKL